MASSFFSFRMFRRCRKINNVTAAMTGMLRRVLAFHTGLIRSKDLRYSKYDWHGQALRGYRLLAHACVRIGATAIWGPGIGWHRSRRWFSRNKARRGIQPANQALNIHDCAVGFTVLRDSRPKPVGVSIKWNPVHLPVETIASHPLSRPSPLWSGGSSVPNGRPERLRP
jgi:hypothetical protein